VTDALAVSAGRGNSPAVTAESFAVTSYEWVEEGQSRRWGFVDPSSQVNV
jgi:hypothetical protein